jgi:hypothetical protein
MSDLAPIIVLMDPPRVPFLNTGHQFFFLPFLDLDTSQRVAVEEFNQGSCRWVLGEDEERQKRLLWLRSRIVKQGEESGLLVALETNVGGVSRGWPTGPAEYPPADTFSRNQIAASAVEPFIFGDIVEAPRDTFRRLARFTFPHSKGPVFVDLELKLEFPHAVAQPLDFNLVVDFGNTRTVVLAIEHNKAANGVLSQICRPISFAARGANPEAKRDGTPIVDSWFVLAEPLFSCLEPPSEDGRTECPLYTHEFGYKTERSGFWIFAKEKLTPAAVTRRIPQSCAQLSPAVMGAEADEILAFLPLEQGGNSFLSSPKRYSWDNDPVGSLGNVGQAFWTMSVNKWHPRYRNLQDKTEFPKLAASVLQLMDENGADWSAGSEKHRLPTERDSAAARPPHSPNAPSYPRSDALTWAALHVIENAYRHVMSDEWRSSMQQKFVHRRLRNVVVTFPSGWTSQELSSYRAKWQKALDIFTAGHIAQSEPRPKLAMELDEAVASQLPIIYGEILKLGNVGENWFELIGRGKGINAKARIMNMDIGGGTTDVAIVEYHDDIPGAGVRLNTALLHKDSSTVAGDRLVRRAIEAVLLPAIASTIENPQLRDKFGEMLRAAKQDKTARWNRVVRQVFIPIVRYWLHGLTHPDGDSARPTAPINILTGDAEAKIKEFNDLCKDHLRTDTVILSGSEPLGNNNEARARLKGCIADTFGDYLASLAKVYVAFDCDFLIVSGKPSELPELSSLILSLMPGIRSRVVFSYNYPVGEWYPLSTDGRINDAKTVTVAGAALYLAIRDGLLPGWMISPSKVSQHVTRNYWGIMSQGRSDLLDVFLPPEEDIVTVALMIEAHIGRRALPTKARPDPVYRIRWSAKGRQEGSGAALVNVTLRRVLPKTEDLSNDPFVSYAEYLEIVSVDGFRNSGSPVNASDLELQLCTLNSSDHWMDAGIFQIESQ